MKRALAALAACLLALAPVAAQAQSAPVSQIYNWSSTTAGRPIITIPLTPGYQSCTVSVYSVGGGASIAALSSGDGGATTAPATGINSGTITSVGVYTGGVATTGVGQFSLFLTSLTSGTASGAVQCGPQAGATSVAASVTFPYSGTTSSQAATGASFLGAGCIYNSAPPTVTNTQFVPLQCNVNGALNTTASVAFPITGANGTGVAGAAAQGAVAGCNFTTSPASLTSGNVGPVSCTAQGYPIVSINGTPTVTNGAGTATIGGVFGAASTSGTGALQGKQDGLANTVVAVKASAGILFNGYCVNSSTTTGYAVQIFNLATGSVTLGTSSPTDQLWVPPASATAPGMGYISGVPLYGKAYGTAISIAATTALWTGAGGTGAPPANTISCYEGYI